VKRDLVLDTLIVGTLNRENSCVFHLFMEGVGGNRNNFLTAQECNDACRVVRGK
jgi:hypothetical protein